MLDAALGAILTVFSEELEGKDAGKIGLQQVWERPKLQMNHSCQNSVSRCGEYTGPCSRVSGPNTQIHRGDDMDTLTT